MNIFLSHSSALEYWNSRWQISRADYSRAMPLAGACPNVAALDEAMLSAHGVYGRPVHLMVHDSSLHSRSKQICTHTCTRFPQAHPFVHVEGNLYVSSPVTLFFQMAQMLSVAKLALLGMELCGTYHYSQHRRTYYYDLPPLTNVRALQAGLERMEGAGGVSRARRALRYVADGAGSPMEAALLVLLCLPPAFGGYGLPVPEFNHRVELAVNGRRSQKTGQHRKCDLYWPKAHFALEYDSNEFHSGEMRRAQDSARRCQLGLSDIEVVSVYTNQIYSPTALDDVARLTARRIGKRLRITHPEALDRQTKLRNEILYAHFDGEFTLKDLL